MVLKKLFVTSFIVALMTIMFSFSFTSTTFAADKATTDKVDVSATLSKPDAFKEKVNTSTNNAVSLGRSIAGGLAVLGFIIAAFFFLSANGDDNKIQKAKLAGKCVVGCLALMFFAPEIVAALIGIFT